MWNIWNPHVLLIEIKKGAAGEQSGSSSKSKTQRHHTTQQFHS